jgi:Tfp pilus assembly protein PilN
MGGIVQQVNLYRENDARKAASAGTRLLMLVGVGALLAVIVLAVGGEIYVSQMSADRAEVAGKLRSREAELARFKEKLTSPVIDPFLESELARLRQVQTHLNANLAAISRHTDVTHRGFSEIFAGLARNTLDGLWFNKVGVAAGGTQMLLQGQTIEPALVPRLLQTLAAEPAFVGRTFRKVTFERRSSEPGGDVVDFELRSAQSVEVEDAG